MPGTDPHPDGPLLARSTGKAELGERVLVGTAGEAGVVSRGREAAVDRDPVRLALDEHHLDVAAPVGALGHLACAGGVDLLASAFVTEGGRYGCLALAREFWDGHDDLGRGHLRQALRRRLVVRLVRALTGRYRRFGQRERVVPSAGSSAARRAFSHSR